MSLTACIRSQHDTSHFDRTTNTNMDWIKDKANAAAGGGKESEKNEDALDKGYTHICPHCHQVPS